MASNPIYGIEGEQIPLMYYGPPLQSGQVIGPAPVICSGVGTQLQAATYGFWKQPDVQVKFPWKTLVLKDDPCFCHPDYEAPLFTRMAEWLKPGMVCIDVGAHQGIWSSFLASRVGPTGFVYAFEPEPSNFAYLAANVAPGAGDAPVACLPIALGSKDEQKQLRCWRHQPAKFASTGMHQLIEGDVPDYTVSVPVRRLDGLKIPNVDFIKIDVEHWEMEVLRGLRLTAADYRPRILVEIHSEENRKFVTDWCRDCKYPFEILTARFPALPRHTSEYVYIQPKR